MLLMAKDRATTWLVNVEMSGDVTSDYGKCQGIEQKSGKCCGNLVKEIVYCEVHVGVEPVFSKMQQATMCCLLEGLC